MKNPQAIASFHTLNVFIPGPQCVGPGNGIETEYPADITQVLQSILGNMRFRQERTTDYPLLPQLAQEEGKNARSLGVFAQV